MRGRFAPPATRLASVSGWFPGAALGLLVAATILASALHGAPQAAAQAASALQIVQGLGDNSGAWLPSFSVDGEGLESWSTFARYGPGIRNYSRKWVYSATRSRAYYAGANHCSPHRFNDVWEYDLAANTWTLLYAPDFNGCIYDWGELKAVFDQHATIVDGVLQTKRSGMLDPGHTWWGMTYDDQMDRLLWMSVWTGNEASYIRERGLQDQVVNDDLPPFWAFDPDARRWELVRTSGPAPSGMMGGSLEYIPSRGISVWYGSEWNGSGMWAFHSQGIRWEQWLTLDETYFNSEAPQAEAVINYDLHNDVLVAILDSRIYIYDFNQNAWRIAGSGPFQGVADHSSAFAYDAVNGVHLLIHASQLYAYHYPTNTVEVLSPAGDAPNGTGMAYFDAAFNALVVYFEGRDRHWVYRYRRAGSPASTFGDVPADHWAHDDIEALYQGGYVVGCQAEPLRLFCPQATLNRAEAAVLVVRGVHGADFPVPQPLQSPFEDVALGDWYVEWVSQLWEDGYTAGCWAAPRRYCPLVGHTRAEATVFFTRMLKGPDYAPPGGGDLPYTDVPANVWYRKWVEAAYAEGIIGACEPPAERDDGLFRPADMLSRAEAACMMARAKGLP